MENQKKKKTIAIGCDHAAIDFKNTLAAFLRENGYAVVDCGSFDANLSVDYPDIADVTCEKVRTGECEQAVLICGTGIGMSMAANKLPGIRAALCSDCYSVKYTRLHNNANTICFGARVMGMELAKELLTIFLETSFEGGRHQRRVDKIESIGRKESPLL